MKKLDVLLWIVFFVSLITGLINLFAGFNDPSIYIVTIIAFLLSGIIIVVRATH